MRKQNIKLNNVYIKSTFSSVGSKEGEGPLSNYFDARYTDELMGQDSWEKAESTLMKNTVSGALTKAGMTPDELSMLFAGDLLNQCTASSFGLKAFDVPFFGLYGACSTFVEGMSLASIAIDSGHTPNAAIVTSSHFCSSQKQYRFPLEYGEVRTPSSQWTVTGSGCAVLSCQKSKIKVNGVTVGKIVDLGVTDANNMGAAMAPAAADTIYTHLCETNTSPEDYDCIVTGDLAAVGTDLMLELMNQRKIDLKKKHLDCGSLIYNRDEQNVDAGGSGCGCVASVFSGFFAKKLENKEIKKMLLVGTGALMSPSSVLLGEPIAGIAHAVELEASGS